MNKIIETFQKLKKEKKKAFIPYITAGDPDLSRTADFLETLCLKGADIIELGVPFSDPMADGPIIQRAMMRALANGTTLKKVLGMVGDFRKKHSTPVVLMGYYNPFYAYGIKKFAEDAKKAGVDGVLTVDLPPEEAHPFTSVLTKSGIIPVFLATPLTDKVRLPAIKKVARGFVYFVSVTGVTGERQALPEEVKKTMAFIKNNMKLPMVMGFGIAGERTIKEFYDHADGFVVGSAIVKRWEKACSSDEERKELERFLTELSGACHVA